MNATIFEVIAFFCDWTFPHEHPNSFFILKKKGKDQAEAFANAFHPLAAHTLHSGKIRTDIPQKAPSKPIFPPLPGQHPIKPSPGDTRGCLFRRWTNIMGSILIKYLGRATLDIVALYAGTLGPWKVS
jgi:hypothetical protein